METRCAGVDALRYGAVACDRTAFDADVQGIKGIRKTEAGAQSRQLGGVMNKVLFVLVCVVVITAARGADLPDHPTVSVDVANGQISVDEDPISSSAGEGGLVWKIAQDGYQFDQSKGIEVDSQGAHECHPFGSDGRSFRCAKLKHVAGATYKYTVNLIDAGSNPLSKDPFIHNH